MALSNTEKGRRFRDRKLAEKKATQANALAAILKTPFFKWAEENGELAAGDNFNVGLDQCGLDTPAFLDDSGPKSFSGDIEELHAPFPDSPFISPSNSLARAEVIIGSLIDAAVDLARVVSDYKRSEINDRISELQEADLSDPDAKKQAFADVTRLQKMLDQLDKQVRFSFQQWKVTGE